MGIDAVELRELRYFVAVAEAASFSRAADALAIGQPPLSKAVRRLESKLALPLFVRTTRRVELTAAGAVLLEEARRVLERATAALRRTQRAGTPRPRLVIAVKPGSAGLMREIVRRYQTDPQWPAPAVLVGGWGEQTAMLRDGRADVALVREPFGLGGLEHDLVASEPRVALLPRDHRLARRRRLQRADLDGEAVPVWPLATVELAAWRAAVDHRRGVPAIPTGPEVHSFAQLVEVVALGQGVAFVPASATRQLGRRDVVAVPVGDITPSRIYVAWPEDCRSRAVAAFVRAANRAGAEAPESLTAAA